MPYYSHNRDSSYEIIKGKQRRKDPFTQILKNITRPHTLMVSVKELGGNYKRKRGYVSQHDVIITHLIIGNLCMVANFLYFASFLSFASPQIMYAVLTS